MITNEQMKPGRYLRWHTARTKVSRIQAHLAAGGIVVVGTPLKAWKFTKPAHAEMFKANRTGAYVQRGKAWDCIDYSAIRFY